MKKYFSYLIYGGVIITLSVMVFDDSKQIKNLILDNSLAQAQVGGNLGNLGGIGTSGTGSSGNYNLDYCGKCQGLYCYNGPKDFICKQESAIKTAQQTIFSLRDEIVYYKNRLAAERADMVLEINRLAKEVDYYAKRIQAENQALQQLQDQNAKSLQQYMISYLQELKKAAEDKKKQRESLIPRLDELAKPNGLIVQLAAEIPKTSSEIDKCLIQGVNECKPSCSGGCHDKTECAPGSGGGLGSTIGGAIGGGLGGAIGGQMGGSLGSGLGSALGGLAGSGGKSCSGGTPSACNISNASTIQNLKSKIASEIQAILNIIGGTMPAFTCTVTPTTGSCEASGGVCVAQSDSCPSNYNESTQYTCADTSKKCCITAQAATCQNPQGLAQQNNEPYPRKNAPETDTLLNCVQSKLAGQNLGEISTYDKTYEICNYTRGKTTCGSCSHAASSCHYGGRTGSQGALAIDFGNEQIGNQIIAAVNQCGGAKSARCETAAGQSVVCPGGTHVHVTLSSCDGN